jgi:ESS family glutamate:Na+ symporter
MILPSWTSVLLAIPVLLLGETLVKRIRLLSRFNIPTPVVGGLLVALCFLAGSVSGYFSASFEAKTTAKWWTWLVTTELEWRTSPTKNVNLPFLVGFFACIGLNASWSLVKRGGPQLLTFLLLASCLAVVQNGIGVTLSHWLGVSPLLGLACGSVTMTGGHATALGFAPDLEMAGLHGAAAVGTAAATFGLVSGALLGGPVGGALIRKHRLQPAATQETHSAIGRRTEAGILQDFRALASRGKSGIQHLLLLLLCIKLGAWVSYFLRASGLTFPIAMGGLLVGVVIRNLSDLLRVGWIQTQTIETLASIALGIFLSVAMMSLNLVELAGVAAAMLMILSVQVLVMGLFAWFVTYRFMGRDFDAAVMAGGHCGFGLGATPTAVANMKALVESFGPAPRAFLVVPIVGAFLIDLVNSINITTCMNLVK